jgi:chitodextrinase
MIMTRSFKYGWLSLAVAAAAASCVHKTEEPGLTGPSGFGRTVTVAATPDRIQQDGASQSSIAVQVIGPNGAPLSGVTVRMDTAWNGTLRDDVGKLAARTIVTGSDGIARTTFTAPGPFAPPDDAKINMIDVQATLTGTDAQTGNPISTTIALTPKDGILPPSEPPTPQLLFFPTAPTVGVSVFFDGTASCPGAMANGACAPTNSGTIASYFWRFGDGTTATGATASHAYGLAQTYPVTLTVTNTRGVSAAASVNVVVTEGDPTAAFTASVANALTHTITFDGSSSTAITGATIVSYQWSFGDGNFTTPSPLPTATHTYSATGSYAVRLVVTDNLGRVSKNPPVTVAVP